MKLDGKEKPLPREMKSMFPNLKGNANNNQTMTTLVIFHAQNDFLKSAPSDSQLEYSLYLNQVAEIVHNPDQPIHHVVMINEQTRSRKNRIGDVYCLRGTKGEAVYPPLMSSISSYILDIPNVTLTTIEGTCGEKPDDHELFAGKWSDHILGHADDFDWEKHEIIIAGLFEHDCSLKTIEFVLEKLVEDHDPDREHEIKMILPIAHDKPSTRIYQLMTGVQSNISADMKMTVTSSSVAEFGIFCPPKNIGNYIKEQKDLQRKVNALSCLFSNTTQKANTGYSDVYSMCGYDDHLFTADKMHPACVFNYKYTDTYGDENINGALYTSPDTTWVEKFYKPYAMLNPETEHRTSNSLGQYLFPLHTNPLFALSDDVKRDLNKDPLFVRGLGKLGKWGANQAADMIRYFIAKDGVYVLVIQRANKMWAVPGGFVDAHESAADAAIREFYEEVYGKPTTGFDKEEMNLNEIWGYPATDETLHGCGVTAAGILKSHVVYRGYSADPRNTLDAWVETTCFASAAESLDALNAEAIKGRAFWNLYAAKNLNAYREVHDVKIILLKKNGSINLNVGEMTHMTSIGNNRTQNDADDAFFAAHAMLLSTFMNQLDLETQQVQDPLPIQPAPQEGRTVQQVVPKSDRNGNVKSLVERMSALGVSRGSS